MHVDLVSAARGTLEGLALVGERCAVADLSATLTERDATIAAKEADMVQSEPCKYALLFDCVAAPSPVCAT